MMNGSKATRPVIQRARQNYANGLHLCMPGNRGKQQVYGTIAMLIGELILHQPHEPLSSHCQVVGRLTNVATLTLEL